MSPIVASATASERRLETPELRQDENARNEAVVQITTWHRNSWVADGKNKALVDDEAAARPACASGAKQSEDVTAWSNTRHSESQDRASATRLARERVPAPDRPHEDEGRMPERATMKRGPANPCATGMRLRRALSRNHDDLHRGPRLRPEIAAHRHPHHGAWASFAWAERADADVCGSDGTRRTGDKSGRECSKHTLHTTNTSY
jgi:hypothetical protein